MTRQQRRAAERQARKQTNKIQPQPMHDAVQNRAGSVSDLNPTRADINRANAQLSTGPRTLEGKAASSRNAIRHGLASNRFYILDWERQEDFDALLENLHQEHQPQTQTEVLLVEQLAQHFWLSQRALHLQAMCFRPDIPVCDQQKELALYIRYQTTNERAFHKTLTTLQALQKTRKPGDCTPVFPSETPAGFVPQNHPNSPFTQLPTTESRASASQISPLPTKNPLPTPKEIPATYR